MRTTLAGLALAALAAFATVVLVARPATAQPDDSVEPDTLQPEDSPPDHHKPRDRSPEERREQREARLDRLVEDGVITPERAAEIRERLAERDERLAERRSARQAMLEDLAATLDLTVAEMKTALREGSSLADLAADAGVDPAVLIEQLVAEAATRIDAAVADGRLDQARANELLADLEALITARVNGEHPERPSGPGRFGRGHGPFGDRGEARFGGDHPGRFGGHHPGRFGIETPGD